MNNIDIKWKNMLSNAKKFYFKNGFHPKRDKTKRLAQWIAKTIAIHDGDKSGIVLEYCKN